MNRVQEGLRNPTDARHTKASSKKQKGLIGRISSIHLKTYKASSSLASVVPWDAIPASRGIARAGGRDPSRDPSDGAKLGERGGS
jgi:hypothetical protein